MDKALTLLQLNGLVRQTLESALPDDYWVTAELSEVRMSGGHCYMELVQKYDVGGGIAARARATIWANTFRLLRPYFEHATGQSFTAGIKVQLLVSVTFHESYGYSLSVHDIDPTYTLGDLARQRREILERLEQEGIINLNKELPMPLLPRRVAVISSASAAGYGDFVNQLNGNEQGYAFQTKLFPAVMQGTNVESTVIAALDAIAVEREHWDVVVIIRGGGAVADLNGFDTYELASNCAQFPLPILTGIGHERDDTVIDSVAHTRVKTPTAAAAFLIGCMDAAAQLLDGWVNALADSVAERLAHERQRLESLLVRLPAAYGLRQEREQHRLALLSSRLASGARTLLVTQQHRLALAEKSCAAASPEHILRQGYSITTCDGHVVTAPGDVHPGDVLITRLKDGEVRSRMITEPQEPEKES